MRQISEETIHSVDSFITNLSDEQKDSLAIRIKEKQPHLQGYFYSYIMSHATPKEMAVLEVIFIYIIRVYEYEYGELEEIQSKSIREHDDKFFDYIESEQKRQSKSTVMRVMRQAAEQKQFILFLETMVNGTKYSTSPFREFLIFYINSGIISTLIMLNDIVELMNQKSSEDI